MNQAFNEVIVKAMLLAKWETLADAGMLGTADCRPP